jgi:hypothetical protein
VKGQPTATLIYELKHDSPTLDSLARRFKFYAENLSIHSYYESRPTKTVVEVPCHTTPYQIYQVKLITDIECRRKVGEVWTCQSNGREVFSRLELSPRANANEG